MASVNKCIFIGNLVRDPEIKYSASGVAFTSFSIAVNEKWKDKQSGENKESVEFVNLKLFARLAEIAGEYLKKGSSVYVEGKIKTEKYTDKNGVIKYTTCVVANEMQMLGGKAKEAEAPRQSEPKSVSELLGNKPAPVKQPVANDFEDDIPF